MVNPESSSNEVREVVREVDKTTAVKLRRIAAKVERDKYRAAVAKSRQEAKSKAAEDRFHAKMELAKIRANQSASETARKNLALTSPAILVILIGGFIIALATGALPEESTATAAALLTMLSAGMLQNLRSLISESNGNGHDEDSDPKPKKNPKKE